MVAIITLGDCSFCIYFSARHQAARTGVQGNQPTCRYIHYVMLKAAVSARTMSRSAYSCRSRDVGRLPVDYMLHLRPLVVVENVRKRTKDAETEANMHHTMAALG